MKTVRAALRARERDLLIAGAILLGFGFVLSLAAAPAEIARRAEAPGFELVWRHGGYMIAGAIFGFAAACLSPREIRRLSALMVLLAWLSMGLILMIAEPTKGARRWLDFGFVSLQPSEFLKPALVVLMAWMISARERAPGFPGLILAGLLLAVSLVLLVRQPDLGQSFLLAGVFVLLAFLNGASMLWLGGALAAGAAALYGAYTYFPYARLRIDALVDPSGEGARQVANALKAIVSGGILGRGPGEGEIKQDLAESHSDFVFAVAAEEFGWFALVLVGVYAWIGWVGMMRAALVADPFQRLAASGLILLFTLQAAIHTAVNVALAPTKGMTLPLVSYGGSSMLGSALTLGFAFAFLRQDRTEEEAKP